MTSKIFVEKIELPAGSSEPSIKLNSGIDVTTVTNDAIVNDAKTVGVDRSIDSTIAGIHNVNAAINKLTTADDALIDPDDSFGFNETSSYFADSATYSPTRQTDI